MKNPEDIRAHGPDVLPPVLRSHSSSHETPQAIAQICRDLNGADLAFVLLFVSPGHDITTVARAMADAFPGTPVMGCTTAGEIGPAGYEDGTLVALGFMRSHFSIRARLVKPLSAFSLDDGAGIIRDLLTPDTAGHPAHRAEQFAIALIDGLSRQEDAIVAALAPSLAGIPLVGGSAGDGLDFGETFVIWDGAVHAEAAIIALVGTDCAVSAFHLDNFTPTSRRMVVTGADPAERLVTEINVEPAAREYARIVGKDPDQLSPFIFAENPVVVRIGGKHYCRSIQKVEANGDLRFYCAIDEGVVLTVARSTDIVEHLDRSLSDLKARRDPALVLGFDCILRKLDVEAAQQKRALSEVLVRHGVVGFNTYGEQFGGMHLNQTFTGVAIYPPGAPD